MKTTLSILAAVVLAGCSAPRTVELPAGTKIMFATPELAADFRSATLIDPEHIGTVVPLRQPVKLIVP